MKDMRKLFIVLLVAVVAVENSVDAQRGYRELDHQRELRWRFRGFSGKRDSEKVDRDTDRGERDKKREREIDSKRQKGSDTSKKISVKEQSKSNGRPSSPADKSGSAPASKPNNDSGSPGTPANKSNKDSGSPSTPVEPKGSKRPQSNNSAKRENSGDGSKDKKKSSSKNNHSARKKHRTKQSKKQMEKLSKRSKSSSSSDGKGKGKGKGNDGGGGGGGNRDDDDILEDDDIVNDDEVIPEPGCRSAVATAILDIVPEVITVNPPSCCNYEGPLGIYVTHALPSNDTSSGLEPFWDAIYKQIATTSEQSDACFVMTGYEPSARSPSDILTDVTVLASSFQNVVAMMVSDPTSEQQLINEIRFITKDPALPSIGVFNAGYNNIVAEALVSGELLIPYVGVTNDADFGVMAAKFTKDALDGKEAKPLCFNGRTDLEFIGERCVAYYSELGEDSIRPIIGVSCAEDSPVEELFNILVEEEVNAVYSTNNCCTVVAAAVAMARSMGQSIATVGCQEADTTGGQIDFVTAQPVQIQGHTPASWVNFPVLQAQLGQRGRQFFPSLDSIVHTDIFTIPIQ
ncbi:hypothetical protein FisN_27Hh084 [Fistulifera solaris]|uniref:Periplasmic binding protein domain-containing protein n=1 Tax=Fistulifera solaris TaxID=1519565 RepID=A0A1Z5KQ71_FISSO|nr:hypothetical protein FisN_27Hh084 [Fistulifera solaris]|eukprot:GAX28265.1 hypothetical protein FisN_27Hh084 [Fistulifera solaris]